METRNRLGHRATRAAIADLGQGNLTTMALKDYLFRNVIASRHHASELHPLDTSWAKGTMVRWAMLGHIFRSWMISRRICGIRSGDSS